MTFGKTLREFMNCTDMKQTQLAEHLGYDVSYVSRWLNDTKLPSTRNSSSLCTKIIRFILKSCTDDSRNIICRTFDIDSSLSGYELENECISILENAYNESSGCTVKAVNRASSKTVNNCNLSQLDLSFEYNNSLLTRFTYELAKHSTVPVLECISIPFTYDYGNNECIPFWMNILQQLPPDTCLHLRMLADISDSSSHIKICRDICSFYGALTGNVSVEFYNIDRSAHSYESLLVFKNDLCVITYQDTLLNAKNVLITQDPVQAGRYYGTVNYLLRGQQPLIHFSSFHALYEKKFFQSFLTSPKLFSLHTVMPMLFVDMEVLKPVIMRSDIPNQILEMYAYYGKTILRWTVLIYKSAIIRFLLDGELNLFLKTIILSEQERKNFIQHLVHKLSEGNRLLVINDVNPVLEKDNFDFSLFLSTRSLFFLRQGMQPLSDVHYSTDSSVMSCFQHLISALISLPEHSAMRGNDVTDFLLQSIELI